MHDIFEHTANIAVHILDIQLAILYGINDILYLSWITWHHQVVASLFNTSFPMNKADRIATFESGSTHAMTLTAVDLDAAGKPVKWKVENSWGADNGFGGCFIMTNDWFNEYMFRLVVNKKYASEQLLKEFDQKPTMLTPDDPLFQLED